MVVILIFLFILVVLLIFTYNDFVSKRNMVDEALSGIDVILKKRFDLIPNLIETIKGYTTHEKDTLAEIVNLRNKTAAFNNNSDKMELDAKLNQAITNIFALAESYPDLKANSNFQSLQTDLLGLETDIERAKRYYNGTVRDYNNAVQRFPGVMIAGSFGFVKKDFLALEDISERIMPKVSF
ncbi:LemA family protein [Flavobacterium sp. 7A]|uniref:LemA family protein n=1 Tax=Flavobacterium sp. 7A TaxID=2940571 RepID=UPI0022279E13|nr:LemA family protein [Flavobacterium sp. 7A]MCW2120233.1 LemA protein [Flavobacterium sp. 7A]